MRVVVRGMAIPPSPPMLLPRPTPLPPPMSSPPPPPIAPPPRPCAKTRVLTKRMVTKNLCSMIDLLLPVPSAPAVPSAAGPVQHCHHQFIRLPCFGLLIGFQGLVNLGECFGFDVRKLGFQRRVVVH